MRFEQQRNELVKICRDLLDKKKVKLILGFTSGHVEDERIPFFIREPRQLEDLKWDNMCTPNLAKYLLEKNENVAIIAKPCDARAIVMYVTENQIDRDKVYIIGVECAGMTGKDASPAAGCAECKLRIPPIYDVLVKNNETEKNNYSTQNSKLEQENTNDNFIRFKNELEKCILCFSCRQACYGCYCDTCFIERGIPDWTPRDPDIGTKMLFHLGRAMHMAGRCVGCGACERACPSGVNIRYLVKDATDFCKELYGYDPGVNPDEIPAMIAFEKDDKEVGFLGGENE